MATKGIKFNGTIIEIPQEYLKKVTIGKGELIFEDESSNKYKFIQDKVSVDSQLSIESENPVQNKVISSELNSIRVLIGDTNSALENILGV